MDVATNCIDFFPPILAASPGKIAVFSFDSEEFKYLAFTSVNLGFFNLLLPLLNPEMLNLPESKS